MRLSSSFFTYAILLILLAGSLAFHICYPFQGPISYQIIGSALIAASFAYVLIRALLTPAPPHPPVSSGARLGQLLAIVLIVPLFYYCYLSDLPRTPTWSEEIWWVEQAKEILRGVRIHPIGFIGDHPANFQSWPVALSLAVFKDPRYADKIPGILYAIFFAYFTAKSVQLFLKSKSFPVVPFVLSLFSVWVIHFAHLGWGAIEIAPVLVSAQIYFISKTLLDRDPRAALLASIAAGLGFWTLYTPFLASLVMTGILLCAPPRVLPWRIKINYLLCFLLIIAPTIGKIAQFPEQSLGRHVNFFMGGEWGKHFDQVHTPLKSYWESLSAIAFHVYPVRPFLDFPSLQQAHLEPVTFALLILGFILSLFRRRLWMLLIPFVAFVGGLLLSNPIASVWREYGLASFLFLYAGIGAQLILDAKLFSGRPYLLTAATVALLVLHGIFFFPRYAEYRSMNKESWGPGIFTDPLYDAMQPMLTPSTSVFAPYTDHGRYVQFRSPFELKLKYYKSPDDVDQIPAGSPFVVIVIDSHPERPEAAQMEHALKDRSLEFERREVMVRPPVQLQTIFFSTSR